MEEEQISRYIQILLFLRKNPEICIYIPQVSDEDHEDPTISIVRQGFQDLDITADEFDLLCNNGVIEFDSGNDDPNLHYRTRVYHLTAIAPDYITAQLTEFLTD